MPTIVILVASVGQGPTSGIMRIRGIVHIDGAGDLLEWTADVAIDSTIAVINNAIKVAAITTATSAGYTIGDLDRKTLLGAAVDI